MTVIRLGASAKISPISCSIERSENFRSWPPIHFSGGGHGGWWENDGLNNGCSSVGISKTQPAEILEQHYPILFEEDAAHDYGYRPAPRAAAD